MHRPYDTKYVDKDDEEIRAWDGHSPIRPRNANDYHSFPIINGVNGSELLRTVILRINGAVDNSALDFPWEDNYVVTETDYIDYWSERTPEAMMPGQLLEQLRQSCYLFVGYPIGDWRLRVFLRRIWGSTDVLGRTPHWAIVRDDDELEQGLWRNFAVTRLQCGYAEYFTGLADFLEGESEDQ
jgi:hypothetical protein